MTKNDYQKLFYKIYGCIRYKYPDWSKKRVVSATKYRIRYRH